MNFLTGVSRILRLEGIIRGDDDEPSDFNDTQHAARIQRAKLAIQSEITHLTAVEMIPYESTSGTITSVSGQRTYTLASDFIGYEDDPPRLVKEDGSGNATTTLLPPYGGGEAQLRLDFPQYREQTGEPTHFYQGTGTTRNIALYMIPATTGTVYRYYYQASVSVAIETDTLPFVNEEEAETFIEVAARRFKYMDTQAPLREQLFPAGLARDPVIQASRSILLELLNSIKKPRKYGRAYGTPVPQDGW
jgi:hypothetical protein